MFKRAGVVVASSLPFCSPEVRGRFGTFSSARAMRALAAVAAAVIPALCLLVQETHAYLPRALLRSIGVGDNSPAYRLLQCSEALGPSKCISALSAWRCERALDALKSSRAPEFDLRSDMEKFLWETYANISDESLNAQLTEGTEKLLRYRPLSIQLPGYTLDFGSKGNGTLKVDILKNDGTTGRGLGKKIMKDFYNLVPIMMIPGLIMSAVLPFVLPMLKMMTVFVGMMNNMALSGAVFTLLRNHAFNDRYEKKIIYVNEGYKNEKLHSFPFKDGFDVPLDLDILHTSSSNVQPVVQGQGFGSVGGNLDNLGGNLGGNFGGNLGGNLGNLGNMGNFNNLQDYPDADWVNQYLPGELNSPLVSQPKVRRSGETKSQNETVSTVS